jgi:hypothetical protein
MADRYPKCATCGHPLPIKPDPALTNEAGFLPISTGRVGSMNRTLLNALGALAIVTMWIACLLMGVLIGERL